MSTESETRGLTLEQNEFGEPISIGKLAVSKVDNLIAESLHDITDEIQQEEIGSIKTRTKSITSLIVNRQTDPSILNTRGLDILEVVVGRSLSNKNYVIAKTENKSKSLSRIGDRRLNKLKILNEENGTLAKQTDSFRKQLDILKKENDSLAEMVTNKNNELTVLKGRALQAVSLARDRDEHSTKLEVIHDSLMSQYEKLIEEKEKDVKEILNLKTQLSNKQKLLTEINKSRAKTGARNSELMSQLSSIKSDNASLKTEIDSLKEKNKQLLIEIKEKNDLISQLDSIKSDNASSKTEIDFLKEKNKQLLIEIKEKNDLISQLELIKNENNSLKKLVDSSPSLASIKEENSELISQLSSICEENKQLRLQIESSSAQNRTKKMDSIPNSSDETRPAHLDEIEKDKDMVIEAYKDMLESKSMNINELLEKNESLELALVTSEAENSQLLSKNVDLLEKIGIKTERDMDKSETIAYLYKELSNFSIKVSNTQNWSTIPTPFKLTQIIDKTKEKIFTQYGVSPKKFYLNKDKGLILVMFPEKKYIKVARNCILCNKTIFPSAKKSVDYTRGVTTNIRGGNWKYDIVCCTESVKMASGYKKLV